MKARHWGVSIAALIPILLLCATARAGVVSITNNLASDIRVGVYAGASESQVTVYAGKYRKYSTFANKSIDKILVVNLAGGSDPVLKTYTVSHPAAALNFIVTVETGGVVTVEETTLPLP